MRLGIFGGTFSPPHTGHVLAARAFVKALSLDKLLIIPTFIPPHKFFGEEASCEERLEMCRLAFGDIPSAEISDIEILRGGKSYTYETLEELYSEDNEIYFLVGTDMLLTFDGWKKPERISELCTLCYVRREEERVNDALIEKKIEKYKNLYGASIVSIGHRVTEISSSELRQRIKDGNIGDNMLPTSVLDYIRERGLYE